MSNLKHKVAVVTGASKGIGAAIAQALGDAGASVVVNYSSDKAGADKVVAKIAEAGGKAVAIQADVAKPADIARLFAEAKKQFGRLDVLVNNAGVFKFAPLDESEPEEFHRQFNINVLGTILSAREAARYFGNEGGNIINVSSVVSQGAFPNSVIYSATKGAVDAVTRVLAAELGPKNIRVNTIAPGMIETEGVHSAGFIGGDFQKNVEATTPLGRIGQPDDVARVALFLASGEAGWVTGERIAVAGGNQL
ncbi:MAG TPA: glucose 1-dehydrogenase [Rhizomicrobium sp.]|nr:glucose 1-dehydrogenase [Rhizomicrobium sp.]